MRTLFWLLVAHSLCDYPLQGDYLSVAKRRGSGLETPWWIALTAHALIHAGAVALVTGSILLGLAELIAHWSIDFAKCEGWFTPDWPFEWTMAAQRRAFTIDQALHVACKIVWAAIA
jgi:hypothetical protein